MKGWIKHPAWFRHGLTVALLIVGGVVGWNNLGHEVTKAGDRSIANERAIKSLKAGQIEIDKKQGIVIQRLDTSDQADRERAIEALRRHNETGRALDRIFDKLDKPRTR